MRKLTHDEISKNRFSPLELQHERRSPIYALLDNVRSLYNVGSIFRTADGARISKLFLSGYTPYPPRTEIEKTALGATLTVPWEYRKDPLGLLGDLRSQQITICVLEHTDKSIPYYSLEREQFPLCLVIGNEISGVSKEIIACADIAADIPMFGMKQSLNAAVAFGIAVFEFIKIAGPPARSHG